MTFHEVQLEDYLVLILSPGYGTFVLLHEFDQFKIVFDLCHQHYVTIDTLLALLKLYFKNVEKTAKLKKKLLTASFTATRDQQSITFLFFFFICPLFFSRFRKMSRVAYYLNRDDMASGIDSFKGRYYNVCLFWIRPMFSCSKHVGHHPKLYRKQHSPFFGTKL